MTMSESHRERPSSCKLIMLVVGPAVVFLLAMKAAASSQGDCNLNESVGATGLLLLLPCAAVSLICAVRHYRNAHNGSSAALTAAALVATALYSAPLLAPSILC